MHNVSIFAKIRKFIIIKKVAQQSLNTVLIKKIIIIIKEKLALFMPSMTPRLLSKLNNKNLFPHKQKRLFKQKVYYRDNNNNKQ